MDGDPNMISQHTVSPRDSDWKAGEMMSFSGIRTFRCGRLTMVMIVIREMIQKHTVGNRTEPGALTGRGPAELQVSARKGA